MKKFLQTSLILLISIFISTNSYAQENSFFDQLLLKNTDYKYIENIDRIDKFESKTYRSGDVEVTILQDGYFFPSSIDATGNHVIIQHMGNANNFFYWNNESGTVNYDGDGKHISNNLAIAGNMIIENFLNLGIDAEAAATFDLESETWTFCGMNEDYTYVTSEIYSSAWDISDDGETVVGIQMQDNYQSFAFTWSEEGGYDNFGTNFGFASRASGISRNGEMVFGWVTQTDGTWSPMIYSNNVAQLLAPGETGEITCASPNGTLVAGKASQMPFYWTEEDGLQNFGSADDYPTIIMDDGGVFSINTIYPPQDRRANYWSPGNETISFNDYAEARGLEDAQDWIFYSVNDVTPDERIFIGIGQNPAGQDIAFRMEFPAVDSYNLSLIANPQEGGTVEGNGSYLAGEEVEITAEANENWEFINWTDESNNVVSTEAIYTYTMPAENITLTANFNNILAYELSLVASPEQGGAVDRNGNYMAGAEVEITAKANENWEFINWTDESNNVISTETSFVYTMPSSDVTITANFEELPTYELSLTANPMQGGEVNGEGFYYAGNMANIVATPNANYTFDSWKDENGNMISDEANINFSMPSNDVLLIAHFELTQNTNDLTNNKLRLYPNPATNQVYVEGLETTICEIYSIDGKKMIQETLNNSQQSIDISKLKSGIYIVKLIQDESIIKQQLKILK